MKLRVKNWEEFQHYKDRCPPWIKLHKKVLDDYEFHCLPDASRALAPCLWLIASEHLEGIFDADIKKLSFRVRQSEKWVRDALKPLVDFGFFIPEQDASDALAERKQDAPLDRGETETENPRSKKAKKTSLPNGFTISDRVAAWASENGFKDLPARLEHFIAYAKSSGRTYADWDAAFQNAIRGDWAKLGGAVKRGLSL